MHASKQSFAVRLLGFTPEERLQIDAMLAQPPYGAPQFRCLGDESLQEPDLFIADGDGRAGLTALARANPSPVQPALLVGQSPAPLPFPRVPRPLHRGQVHEALGELVARRTQVLLLLSTSKLPLAPERRRHPRADAGHDDAVYAQQRQAPPCGAVLILDNRGAFRDHVARLVGSHRLAVEWTDSAPVALRLCDETPVSLVMINTALPGIDPYAVCSAIKAQDGSLRTAVVFLCSPAFRFDHARARDAGVRGVLDKPVGDRHLVAALNKLLSA